ncbi:MAG: hypothetical protein DI626_06555 [Micavibrio aeruginosavorus]|uniref:Uncharacterized protein n=1 Tax=Micavibrio aeruginosavorus TaxID=349221 RepID=A0A2W4ZVR5_9BACT|nr:MAG: hypothetical protein DI626_06555 [Micavibrio aeruginosavorus]
MLRKGILASVFTVAAGLVLQASPASAVPRCETPSHPLNFNYVVHDVPNEDVMTAERYVVHFEETKEIMTKGAPRRSEEVPAPKQCSAMPYYQFYFKTEDLEKQRGKSYLNLSTNLDFQSPEPTRECLNVPVTWVRIRPAEDDPEMSVLSFYIDEARQMAARRGTFYKGDMWCHTLEVRWQYVSAAVPNVGPR